MKKFLGVVLLSLLSPLGLFAQTPISATELSGAWQYYGFEYEGNFYAPVDKEIELKFVFVDEQMLRLFWTWSNNKEAFCDRYANYSLKESRLTQEVIWVNPKNTSECAKDPDMRVGTKTENDLTLVSATELRLHLSLGGKPLLYFLRRK
jgi:hypothetical protein